MSYQKRWMALKKNDISLPFVNRKQAGELLGESLQSYSKYPNVIVLALPRGGVPVGFEVAKTLKVPLDLMLVRKLGVPGHRELAMGAIASGDVRVLNQDVISAYNISTEVIDQVATEENKELQRRYQAYRDDLPPPELNNRCVILVDDGIATGATMRAAVAALKQTGASEVIVAVPVGALETIKLLNDEADKVICLAIPDMLFSIGQWYTDFTQVSDEEVCNLLASISHKTVETTE